MNIFFEVPLLVPLSESRLVAGSWKAGLDSGTVAGLCALNGSIFLEPFENGYGDVIICPRVADKPV